MKTKIRQSRESKARRKAATRARRAPAVKASNGIGDPVLAAAFKAIYGEVLSRTFDNPERRES